MATKETDLQYTEPLASQISDTTAHIPGKTETQGGPDLFTPAGGMESITQPLASPLKKQKILEGTLKGEVPSHQQGENVAL